VKPPGLVFRKGGGTETMSICPATNSLTATGETLKNVRRMEVRAMMPPWKKKNFNRKKGRMEENLLRTEQAGDNS